MYRLGELKLARILILANNDVGLYKFRKELIQELLNNGNEVYISLPNGQFIQQLVNMGCKYIQSDIDRRGLNPFKDIKLLILYLSIFNKVKPDMVITYTVKPNIYGGIISRIKKIPYYINITGLGSAFQSRGYLKKIIVTLYKLSCKKANIVFFENDENKKIFVENNIIEEAKSFKLNGAGVNLEEYQLYEYPVDNSELRFLFIGRVMKEKGIDELFEAAKLIKNEFTDVYFDIIGPLEDDYLKIIEQLESEQIIKYYGFQDDIKPFIAQSHCFILPSYHEGMANTLLECGAMGRPLITSNIYGCKESVSNNKNGYLVKPKSTQDLYEKIKQFIELSYEQKKNMGKFSRKHIEKNFDKKKVVDITIENMIKVNNKNL